MLADPAANQSFGGRVLARRSSIGCVVTAGIVLRCVQAFEDRALWLDEAMLALNIRRLSFSELCGPLQYDQAAPVAFLWLQKLVSFVVWDEEVSARIVPWAAGCLALLVFAILATKVAAELSLLPVTVMAFSPTLVCYSGEGKQYSVDVLCSVFALCVGMRWVRSPDRSAALLAALYCTVAPWFSHTGVFFLPGVLLLAVVFRKRTGWALTLGCALGSVSSVLMLYLVNIRKVHGNSSLNEFWQSDYVPWKAIERGPTEFEAVAVWMIRRWWELVVRSPGLSPEVPPATAAWFAVAVITTAMTWILWRVISELSASTLLLISYAVLPVFSCLVAAAFERYPFGNRLLLFAAPLVVFLLAHFPLTTAWNRIRQYHLDALLSAVLLTWPLVSICETVGEWRSIDNMFAPHYEEDIRPFVAQMVKAQSTAASCYVFHAARPAFEYYSRDGTQHVFFGSPGDSDHYRDEVRSCLARNPEWYFLFAHTSPWGMLEPHKAYEYLTEQRAEEFVHSKDDVRFFVTVGRQIASHPASITAEEMATTTAASADDHPVLTNPRD